MFVFLVTLGWTLIIIGALAQIFTAILNLLVMQNVALPSILKSMNDIFQTSIFKQEQILNNLTGDVWSYTIIVLTMFVALLVMILVSFQLHRVRKGQLIAKPYIKMIFVTLIIAALIYGKVAVLILEALVFIGLLFVESSLFDVSSLQNFVEERNMIVIYHQEKKLEREVNKEGKYHGSVTLGADATVAGIDETAKSFNDNGYGEEDDNKKLSEQKSTSMFSSNELNNLFNTKKDDVDENELANLINDMTQTMTNPQKTTDLKTKIKTSVNTPKQQSNDEVLSQPSLVNEKDKTETLEQAKMMGHPFHDNKLANDAKFNTNIKTLVDKAMTSNEENAFDEAPDEEQNFAFLEDQFLNPSEKVMTRKEQHRYDRWNEMYQQALNIKEMVEAEVQTTDIPIKAVKKKVKIYNLIAKEANKLAKKLKLEADYELELMHISEMYSANSQATADFLEDDNLENSNSLELNSKDINNIMNDYINVYDDVSKTSEHITFANNDFNDVVNNDEIKKEIEDMHSPSIVTEQEPQQTGVNFIPSDHNIDKLKGELLPEIQTSDDTDSDSDNVQDDYSFSELKGLVDDLQDNHLENFDITENKQLSEEKNNDEIKTRPVEEKVNLVAPQENKVAETLIADVELAPEPKVKQDKLTQVKKESEQGELLDAVVVSSETTTASQPENKPLLKEEVSYSLDELDDKIMSGDFSNLDDEVIEYFDKPQLDVIEKPEVKKEVNVEQQKPLQQSIPNDIEYRIEKIEELIKNSIDLHTAHTKTLGEMQGYLHSLTAKVEALETKTIDFAKKIKEVETKKDIKYHGVVPIDQFYPQINNINLTSPRYNLYNKKGYSNTYGAINASDNAHGVGQYYRPKMDGTYQNDKQGSSHQFVDYNHLNLHNISKYTKQDIPFEVNCPFCKKENK